MKTRRLGIARISLAVLADMIAESGCRNFEAVGALVDEQDRRNSTISVIVESEDLPELADGVTPPEVNVEITVAMQTAKVAPR